MDYSHFWERWWKEYLTDLGESHKVKSPYQNHPSINLDDAVLVEEEKQPRSAWKMSVILELYKAKNDKIRVAGVKFPGTNSIIKRLLNRLY